MNYKDLDVFKDSHKIVLEIYNITKDYPETEKYRLIDQMIRAAYSVPANIAEGNSRNTTKDYINYLYIARGSINELKYFLLLSKDLNYININEYSRLKEKCVSIAKQLNGLINSLKKKNEQVKIYK